MKPATRCIRFLESLRIPEGPRAGEPLKLAPFQRRFVKGALADEARIGVLSIGRGNAKTALASGIALGALVGVWDSQPRREIILAARTREQARIAWNFATGFANSLPDELRERMRYRKSPHLEIELRDENGPHLMRAIPADGRSALGLAPNLVLMDERGHWERESGDALEAALLSALGKRGGRALVISTSASDDTHAFSRWVDDPPPGTYVQEHRPPPGLPADDRASLLEANPGAKHGIGSPAEWLEQEARRAIAQGGSALNYFRLYNRNERVSDEVRDVLLTVDEWLGVEATEPAERSGPVVVGIDVGGSDSMSAAAFYWPETGRLEVSAALPSEPSLADRGARDGVQGRYLDMHKRGELVTLGAKTVPLRDWLASVFDDIAGETVSAVVADRFKQAEFEEGLAATGVRAPIVWRGMGYRDGGEDVERFRRAVFDGRISTRPSLLMRSAISEAVVLRDPADNRKLAKARSKGKIDAVAAAVLAVAEGSRQTAKPKREVREPVWV